MSSPPRSSSFTSKYPTPPGELPFTHEEELIINDLSKHQDILSQISKTLESQPGSSPSSIADIIREIIDHPSTNPADIPEFLDLASILTATQSDVPGPDVIDPAAEQKRRESVLEVLDKVFQIKHVDPASRESSLPQSTEPPPTGQPSTSTAGQTAIPNLQAPMRGLQQKPTPTCFAGLKPEFQGKPFNFTINGVPQSSLADTLRTLQGFPWVPPPPTDPPTVSTSLGVFNNNDESDSIDNPD
jgi:hypothetical protein